MSGGQNQDLREFLLTCKTLRIAQQAVGLLPNRYNSSVEGHPRVLAFECRSSNRA